MAKYFYFKHLVYLKTCALNDKLILEIVIDFFEFVFISEISVMVSGLEEQMSTNTENYATIIIKWLQSTKKYGVGAIVFSMENRIRKPNSSWSCLYLLHSNTLRKW